ncbi:unnamed protein product [Menidia menidia]|uniref:(Atlantic silverside) hypothetical protein n=1 Tax=Menidia menidia TaxID=238744 RepID=A0A8S4AFR6_9TELE|nr:unnamed protein product [Menidia menidia]
MGESIDVKALRNRFNNQAGTSNTSSRDSGSPKSPRPSFGRGILPVTENQRAQRHSPTVPLLLASPGLVRLPRADPMAASIPTKPASSPRPPPNFAIRAPFQPTEVNKIKQTGELLQNMIRMHQGPADARPMPTLAPSPVQILGSSPTATPRSIHQQPRQRSAGDVTPLRKPLPLEGPIPLKPKRPPLVNLEPFRKTKRGPAFPAPRLSNGSEDRRMSVPALTPPPNPPLRSNKPKRLLRQVASVGPEDEQDTYDDIGSFDKNESCSENSSQCIDGDDDDDYEDTYEEIDENLTNQQQPNPKMKNAIMRQEEQIKKEQQERQKRLNDLKKNFQLQGDSEVLHTARVRHDWNGGGKLDLSVRQGESVEIMRVKDNPGGKWLARSLNGNYGYISNTCVDIDYEAVKIKALQSRKRDTELPPPPPDPPKRDSMLEDDDSYDDVQPLPADFPPPPPEISMDPKMEKELRKKFKYEGPFLVLHSMMVNPNAIIKKPGNKELHVNKGEVLDIIQLTSAKKALCRNRHGKYGYVSRSLLLPMEGDIYDDVDYPADIYDNDYPNVDY